MRLTKDPCVGQPKFSIRNLQKPSLERARIHEHENDSEAKENIFIRKTFANPLQKQDSRSRLRPMSWFIRRTHSSIRLSISSTNHMRTLFFPTGTRRVSMTMMTDDLMMMTMVWKKTTVCTAVSIVSSRQPGGTLPAKSTPYSLSSTNAQGF
jgi:hypothetical protein